MDTSVEREQVREGIRRLLRADRERGVDRGIPAYGKLFPGYGDIVAEEHRAATSVAGGTAEAGGTDATRIGPASPGAEGGDSAPPPSAPVEAAVGPYRVLREIGRGGMGVVYLAEDTRLPRRVALKVLPPAFSHSPQLLLRFRREAEVAARLDHPGICTVYEAGESDGTCWIAMRFVEGETLADAVAAARAGAGPAGGTGPRTVAARLAATASLPADGVGTTGGSRQRAEVMRVLRLVEKAARALHAAHEVGLVHRDVKPANIMATPEGEPVLLDFGVARETAGEEAPLTRTGTLVGTPVYMAPEALHGTRGPPDRRGDVYSLGVTLYECLTLRLPFDAPTLDGLHRLILESEPEDPRRLNPAIPRDLAVVIETALEKDPGRRYKTALALAEDLRRVREFEPIAARPAGTLLRLRRWAQRKPAVAAFLALLVAALGTTSWLLAETRGALGREKETAGSLREAKGRVEEALRAVRARALANASREALKVDPMLSLLLAREAAGLVEDPETMGQLHAALAESLERARPAGHAGPIHSVDWSPSGDLLLTASADGTVRLHDPSGAPRAVLPCGATAVAEARFSPDGGRVAAACTDGGTRLFDREGRPLPVLSGHRGPVLSVGWSPDGGRLLTSSSDGTARTWSMDGRPLAVLAGHRGAVLSSCFSPDGTRVLTASSDGTARLWSAAGEETAVLEGGGGEVLFARFSPDGRRILAGTEEGRVRLFDGGGVLLASHGGHGGAVVDGGFSPSGDLAVTASHDGTARVLGPDGRERAVLRGHGKEVMAAAFSPDGRRIATASYDGTARLWDAEGSGLAVLRGHGAEVTALRFSPDGRSLLTSTGGTASKPSAILWDLDRVGEFVLRDHRGWVRAVAFSPDGSFLATAGEDGTVRLRGREDGPGVLRGHRGAVRRIAFSARGDRLLSASDDGTVRLWDPGGAEVAVLEGSGSGVVEAPLSPDGRRVAAGYADGTALLWKVAGGEPVPLRGHGPGLPVARVRFSADGSRILTASADRTVRLWSGSGEPAGVLGPFPGNLRWAEFSPGGDRVLASVGAGDTSARLLDLAGAEKASFPHADVVLAARFSPDGRRVLTTSVDGTAALWTPEAVLLARLPDHGCPVVLGEFSPRGDRLLTGAEDGTVRLWDGTGRPLLLLPGHGEEVITAAFSPDGRRAATGSKDGTARLWITDPAEIRALADRRASRPFTAGERARLADLLGEGAAGAPAAEVRPDGK